MQAAGPLRVPPLTIAEKAKRVWGWVRRKARPGWKLVAAVCGGLILIGGAVSVIRRVIPDDVSVLRQSEKLREAVDFSDLTKRYASFVILRRNRPIQILETYEHRLLDAEVHWDIFKAEQVGTNLVVEFPVKRLFDPVTKNSIEHIIFRFTNANVINRSFSITEFSRDGRRFGLQFEILDNQPLHPVYLFGMGPVNSGR